MCKNTWPIKLILILVIEAFYTKSTHQHVIGVVKTTKANNIITNPVVQNVCAAVIFDTIDLGFNSPIAKRFFLPFQTSCNTGKAYHFFV